MKEKAPRAPYKRDEDGKWYFGLAIGPFETRGEARAQRAHVMKPLMDNMDPVTGTELTGLNALTGDKPKTKKKDDGPKGLKNALVLKGGIAAGPVVVKKKKVVTKPKSAGGTRKVTAKKVTKKKAKVAGRKGEGIVDAIRTGFQAGNTTVAEVEAYLRKVKVQASPNTVKTQVGRLRKAAGLTKVRKEKGIVATIRKGYAKGNDTVAKMARFLDKAGVEASPNTIKTQVGRLRRADGLTGRAA